MSISGTIGYHKVVATIYPERVEIKQGNAVLHNITELWMVGLQRVSKQLKTCDVVWIDGATQKAIIQSIDQSAVETVVRNVTAEVVMLGMDPPAWSKLSATAHKNKWHKEDWLHVFSEEDTEDDDDDDEWKPSENVESEDSEDEESDEDSEDEESTMDFVEN